MQIVMNESGMDNDSVLIIFKEGLSRIFRKKLRQLHDEKNGYAEIRVGGHVVSACLDSDGQVKAQMCKKASHIEIAQVKVNPFTFRAG